MATGDKLVADALRWVRPGEIPDRADLTWPRLLALLFRHPPLRAMLWFRIGTWCKQHRLPVLPGLIQRHIYFRFGLEIWVGAEIGGGLYVPHPSGTVIAIRRMGRNCSVIHSATLGMRNRWEFPDIGDEVFIGAGARVLGGISVGSRAVIGANAVVLHDVPIGATVVGVPARVVRGSGIQTQESVTEERSE